MLKLTGAAIAKIAFDEFAKPEAVEVEQAGARGYFF